MEGLKFKNNKNGWGVLSIHYTADDERRKPEWVEKAKKGFTKEAWDREMEMKSIPLGDTPVYKGVDDRIFVDGLKWQVGKTIFRGWDFGYQLGCCVFAYKNTRDQLCVIKEVLVYNGTTQDLARAVVTASTEFPDADFQDYCDIAGKHHGTTSNLTDIEILNSFGFYPNYSDADIERGLDKIRLLYRLRDNDEPGMLVSTECNLIHKGFLGKYLYGNTHPPKPKDSYYADVHDALRYLVDNNYQHLNNIDEEEQEDIFVDRDICGLPKY